MMGSPVTWGLMPERTAEKTPFLKFCRGVKTTYKYICLPACAWHSASSLRFEHSLGVLPVGVQFHIILKP